jgi:hypothetical protein
MNREKKEAKRKHEAARKGLSKDQIAALDLEDLINDKIEKLARQIHGEKFTEEYDFTQDSIADAKDRGRGINPMSQEYIEKIKKKREKLGVSQLAENGMPVSNDTHVLCENEAKRQIYSDLKLKRPPAKTCIFCNKTLDEIGGKRLSAQQLRGVALSDKYKGGGNEDFPHQSVKLFDDSDTYMVVWGEKAKWTESAIAKAKNEYQNGKNPWFCQICGERKCRKCGSPTSYPMGSDILYGDGCSSHAAIFPFDPGCINPDCVKYKEWNRE